MRLGSANVKAARVVRDMFSFFEKMEIGDAGVVKMQDEISRYRQGVGCWHALASSFDGEAQ
jgi:hypothetical protein